MISYLNNYIYGGCGGKRVLMMTPRCFTFWDHETVSLYRVPLYRPIIGTLLNHLVTLNNFIAGRLKIEQEIISKKLIEE